MNTDSAYKNTVAKTGPEPLRENGIMAGSRSRDLFTESNTLAIILLCYADMKKLFRLTRAIVIQRSCRVSVYVGLPGVLQ